MRTRACARSEPGARCIRTGAGIFQAATDLAAFERLAGSVHRRRYGGTDCYAYAMVAAGWTDIVCEKRAEACTTSRRSAPVIAGAGGMVTDWAGNPLEIDSKGGVIALGDARLLPEALKLLGAGI